MTKFEEKVNAVLEYVDIHFHEDNPYLENDVTVSDINSLLKSVMSKPLYYIDEWCKENEFDQCIIEKNGTTRWVHISYREDRNRRKIFRMVILGSDNELNLPPRVHLLVFWRLFFSWLNNLLSEEFECVRERFIT